MHSVSAAGAAGSSCLTRDCLLRADLFRLCSAEVVPDRHLPVRARTASVHDACNWALGSAASDRGPWGDWLQRCSACTKVLISIAVIMDTRVRDRHHVAKLRVASSATRFQISRTTSHRHPVQLDFKFHLPLCVVILSEVRRQPNGVEGPRHNFHLASRREHFHHGREAPALTRGMPRSGVFPRHTRRIANETPHARRNSQARVSSSRSKRRTATLCAGC
jgi:hypothetical protein